MADYDFPAMTKEFEGWRPDIYYDTKGIPTIGYGFNLENAIAEAMLKGRKTITKEEAEPIFWALYNQAQQDAEQAIGSEHYNQLPQEAQGVFTDMSYNLGLDKFDDFIRMIGAAREQDWERVGEEMKDSKWWTDVGRRSKKLFEIIQSLSNRSNNAETNE